MVEDLRLVIGVGRRVGHTGITTIQAIEVLTEPHAGGLDLALLLEDPSVPVIGIAVYRRDSAVEVLDRDVVVHAISLLSRFARAADG